MDDGGAIALGGFFYQLLGSGCRAFELHNSAIANDEQAECIVTLILESAGQDAIVEIEPAERTEIAQFKYSRTPETHPIQPAELYEICLKLREAIEVVDDSNSQVLPVLISNRPLSPGAQAELSAAISNLPCKSIDDHVQKKEDGKKTCFEGRTLEGNKLYREFLRTLQVRTQSLETIRSAIQARAAKFGLLGPELLTAVSRLAGPLVDTAISSVTRRISHATLDSWLTGDPEPNILRHEKTAKRIAEHIAAQQKQVVYPFKPLIRREVLNQIREASTSALIQLSGFGGCGKTAAALLALEELASVNPLPPPFLAVGFAETFDDQWLGSLFCNWRNSLDKKYCLEAIRITIERILTCSSQGDLPDLVLVLDGLDEVPSGGLNRAAILSVLTYFSQEHERCNRDGVLPRVKLIVTCRNYRELHDDWLSRSGFEVPLNRAEIISVGDLTDFEILTLSDDFVPLGVAKRLRASAKVRLDDRGVSLRALDAQISDGATHLEVIDPEISESLRHPVLLGLLNQLDADLVHRLMSGNDESVRALGEEYIKWFCKKSQKRSGKIPVTTSRHILKAVVDHQAGVLDYCDIENDWIQPGSKSVGNQLEPSRVFEEACSTGMVVLDGPKGKWRWKNHIVCASLTS